jgi:hypothetical protein
LRQRLLLRGVRTRFFEKLRAPAHFACPPLQPLPFLPMYVSSFPTKGRGEKIVTAFDCLSLSLFLEPGILSLCVFAAPGNASKKGICFLAAAADPLPFPYFSLLSWPTTQSSLSPSLSLSFSLSLPLPLSECVQLFLV